jgi:hypothetical protein
MLRRVFEYGEDIKWIDGWDSYPLLFPSVSPHLFVHPLLLLTAFGFTADLFQFSSLSLSKHPYFPFSVLPFLISISFS